MAMKPPTGPQREPQAPSGTAIVKQIMARCPKLAGAIYVVNNTLYVWIGALHPLSGVSRRVNCSQRTGSDLSDCSIPKRPPAALLSHANEREPGMHTGCWEVLPFERSRCPAWTSAAEARKPPPSGGGSSQVAVAKGHGFHPGEGQKAYGQKVGGECAGTRRERGLGAHQHPHELPFWDTSSPMFWAVSGHLGRGTKPAVRGGKAAG